MQRIPSDVSLKVRMLGNAAYLRNGPKTRLPPALCNSAMQQRWGESTHESLKEVIALSALADDARRRAELTRQQEAIARAREEAAQKQREHELIQARELAEARQKTNRRTLFGLIVAALLAIFGLTQAYYVGVERSKAETKSQIARLQSQLARANSINIQKNYLENRANTNLGFYFELQRDSQRGLTQQTVNQAEGEAADAQKSRDHLLREAGKLGAGLTGTISQIGAENERMWSNDLSKAYREKIIANVVEGLNSFPYKTLENKLRVALYAVAAIPEENAALSDLLRKIIEENRQRSYFRASSASQIWGLALTQRTSGQLAAIGDDNGVVWIWDPLAGPGGPPKRHLPRQAVS